MHKILLLHWQENWRIQNIAFFGCKQCTNVSGLQKKNTAVRVIESHHQLYIHLLAYQFHRFSYIFSIFNCGHCTWNSVFLSLFDFCFSLSFFGFESEQNTATSHFNIWTYIMISSKTNKNEYHNEMWIFSLEIRIFISYNNYIVFSIIWWAKKSINLFIFWFKS